MKTVYICEKCGKEHADYSDAWNCECSHADPETMYGWNFARNDHFPLATYKPDESAPHIVYMRIPVLTDSGCIAQDDHGCPRYIVYPFKRLAHDAVCAAMEASMVARYYEDNPITETEDAEG